MTTVKSLSQSTGVSLAALRGLLVDAGVRVGSDCQVITNVDARRIADFVARRMIAQVAANPQAGG